MGPKKGAPRAPIKTLPPRDVLRQMFNYDPESGALTWRPRPGVRGFKFNHGEIAGTLGEKGYIVVGVSKRYYLAHRVIWKLVTGVEPTFQIDHTDGDRANNRWVNLRAADNSRNLWNSRLRSDNTSGYCGVQRKPGCITRPWTAILSLGNGKYRHLGTFETSEMASQAWMRAAEQQRGSFFRAK